MLYVLAGSRLHSTYVTADVFDIVQGTCITRHCPLCETRRKASCDHQLLLLSVIQTLLRQCNQHQRISKMLVHSLVVQAHLLRGRLNCAVNIRARYFASQLHDFRGSL